MKNEVGNQAVKAVPAVTGAAYAANSLTYAEIAAIATILYVALQIVYLLWRWNNDRNDRRA